MKKLALFLTTLASMLVFAKAQPSLSAKISLDENGFVTCFQSQDQTYFFSWDPYVRTPERVVTYFELKDYVAATSHFVRSCKDVAYVKDAPGEIQKDISRIKPILPERVSFSLQQIAEGAGLYRTEKTPQDYIANRKSVFLADHPEVLSRLRQETGDHFALEVIKLFTKDVAVKNVSCASLIGTCDFYLCQEQKNPCGLDGYNLHSGYKYCSDSKFKLRDEMRTPLGKSWVTDVFQCLQKKNLENAASLPQNDETCALLKKEAYESHPDCYVAAGFCKLKGFEKKKIFSLIKKEIFSIQTLTQGVQLLKQCASED